MDHLNISDRREDRFTRLDVSGTVNSYTFGDFQEKIFTLIKTSDLVLDMSRVTNLSSSGLGVLMAAQEVGQESGHRLFILSPSEIVRLAIESTGFADLFPVIHSPGEIG